MSLVFHIPHSRIEMPSDVRAALCLPDDALASELLRMTDHHTEALFRPAAKELSAAMIVYPVSRLVADPERFEDDDAEPMARVGMGVIYERTADGGRLRASAPPAAERRSLLDRYYRPHHARLTAAVAEALGRDERCLVLDCHSFPSQPLPYELDQAPNRPDLCLGTDDFHTSATLRDVAIRAFESEGLGVAVNRPFAGALVPMGFYRTDVRVSALMIEVNRRLYMDEQTGQWSHGFERIQEILRRAIGRIVESGGTRS